MANKALVYPSGFSRIVNEITESLVTDNVKPRRIYATNHDVQVEVLYLNWITNPNECISWDERRKFILYYNKLYGNFWTWLEQQLVTNDYIYEMNLDFLIDTLRFILTGTRTVHIRNWRDLITEYPSPRPGIASKDRLVLLQELLSSYKKLDNFNYIGMWCSHESGFEDLIYTTQILFGKPVQNHRNN